MKRVCPVPDVAGPQATPAERWRLQLETEAEETFL
jgi:hypothetical protein